MNSTELAVVVRAYSWLFELEGDPEADKTRIRMALAELRTLPAIANMIRMEFLPYRTETIDAS